MERSFLLMLIFALAVCVGCGGNGTLVPVSGTVTLDDAPLESGTITFLPIADEGDEAGVPSTGKISQGKYTLKTSDDQEGAVIANHRVMIFSVDDTAVGEGDVEEDVEVDVDDNVYTEQQEKIPARYNTTTTLKFEVTSEGSDAADFSLSSQRDEFDIGPGNEDDGS